MSDRPPPGYAPAGPWVQPTPTKRRTGLIIGIVVLAVFVVGAAGAVLFLTSAPGRTIVNAATSGANRFYTIPSGAMSPTLEPGDRIGVKTKLRDIRRGDVVVFHVDSVPNIKAMVKRVVGLPGETIDAPDGRVLINGRILPEPYLRAGTVTEFLSLHTIPSGQYFVMGDNRSNSSDSRNFGLVPASGLRGVVVRIVSPARRAGRIRGSPR